MVIGGALGGVDKRLRQSCEVALAVEHEVPGLLILQDVLHKLRDEAREAGVDRLNTRLRSRRQPGACAHECQVMAFENALVFIVEIERVAAFVEIVDPAEEPRIEQHLCFVRGKARRHLTGDVLQFRCRVGCFDIAEDGTDAGEQRAAFLKRQHRVGERRARGIRRDLFDLGFVLAERGIQCRAEMFGFDFGEWWRPECCRPAAEKRVLLAARGA